MNNPLRTPEDYELFLYSLTENFRSLSSSTLTFIRVGATLAKVVGELHFGYEIKLVVRERLIFDRLPGVIDAYSYEVLQGANKLYWYDSQPHPNDPTLQSAHPHHKHIPPDIKHHRIPAPELSFTNPNITFLIGQVEKLIAHTEEK